VSIRRQGDRVVDNDPFSEEEIVRAFCALLRGGCVFCASWVADGIEARLNAKLAAEKKDVDGFEFSP